MLARGTESCRQLMTVPGAGPIIASAMMAAIGNGALPKGVTSLHGSAWCRSKCRRAIGRSSVTSAGAGTAICACCSCRVLALFCSDRKTGKSTASEREIGCARISRMARSTNAPFKRRIQKRKI